MQPVASLSLLKALVYAGAFLFVGIDGLRESDIQLAIDIYSIAY